ncbi:hypothetical protein ACS0TY_036921 [Phlomoides rotata]
MDSNYGIARELSDLQKLRSQYKPELPPYLQDIPDGAFAALCSRRRFAHSQVSSYS